MLNCDESTTPLSKRQTFSTVRRDGGGWIRRVAAALVTAALVTAAIAADDDAQRLRAMQAQLDQLAQTITASKDRVAAPVWYAQ